jgi:hypothetical protein
VSGDSFWFSNEFGFEETGTWEQIRRRFSASVDPADGAVKLTAGGREFHVGSFQTPSVMELRAAVEQAASEHASVSAAASAGSGSAGKACAAADSAGAGGAADRAGGSSSSGLKGLRFQNISGCAKSLHLAPENAGSVFQVASQLNCLEMVGPGERPESGVTQYFRDKVSTVRFALGLR